MDVLGVELVPAYLLGIVVWLTAVAILVFIGYRTRKAVLEGKAELKAFAEAVVSRNEAKLDAIVAGVKPFLGKVEAALDGIPSLDPASLASSFEPMLVQLFDARIGPWASKMGNDLLGQIDSRIEHFQNTFRPLTNIANKVFASEGGTAKAAVTRNREVAENIRRRIPNGLLSLLPKKLKNTDDPAELIDGLMQFKPLADRFAPGILDQFLTGIGTEGTTGVLGMPGINVPASTVTPSKASYMTE